MSNRKQLHNYSNFLYVTRSYPVELVFLREKLLLLQYANIFRIFELDSIYLILYLHSAYHAFRYDSKKYSVHHKKYELFVAGAQVLCQVEIESKYFFLLFLFSVAI